MSETTETPHKFFKRHDLVAAVAERTALPRTKAITAVEAMFEAIQATLKSGQEVRLVGFGSFSVTDRKAGKGRDPRTGVEIDIPPSKSVRFRAGKSLKEAVGAKAGKGGKKKREAAEAAVAAEAADVTS
jgi:DNA-binding protein HU-beta